jgi:hypothetical protein
MSNSVFLPKNGNAETIKDVLSATSAVPTWLNGSNKKASNLKKDILNLVGEIQGGGKKKVSKKSSKKGPKKGSKKLIEDIIGGAKKVSKKASKKMSKKTTKKGSKKLTGGAVEVTSDSIELFRPKAKKVSKKTSKTSKKGSKKMSRELPPAIVKGNQFKEHVQKDMGLKGGPVLMTFSYMIWNEFKGKNANASPDELLKGSMELYNNYKKQGKLESMYKEAEKKFADKKAAKKAAKNQ